jgi:hypothetical protein
VIVLHFYYLFIQTIRGNPCKDDEFCVITIGSSCPSDLVYARPEPLHTSEANLSSRLVSMAECSVVKEKKDDDNDARNIDKEIEKLSSIPQCDTLLDQLSDWTTRTRKIKVNDYIVILLMMCSYVCLLSVG